MLNICSISLISVCPTVWNTPLCPTWSVKIWMFLLRWTSCSLRRFCSHTASICGNTPLVSEKKETKLRSSMKYLMCFCLPRQSLVLFSLFFPNWRITFSTHTVFCDLIYCDIIILFVICQSISMIVSKYSTTCQRIKCRWQLFNFFFTFVYLIL